jgi:hypothetical protein
MNIYSITTKGKYFVIVFYIYFTPPGRRDAIGYNYPPLWHFVFLLSTEFFSSLRRPERKGSVNEKLVSNPRWHSFFYYCDVLEQL